MMSESDFLRWLADANARVEERLTMNLRRLSAPPPLIAAMQYCALNGGKRLRPAMLLAVADADNSPTAANVNTHAHVNNTDADADADSHVADTDTDNNAAAVSLNAACALECIHCYSLAHDDLPCMDNADTRRQKPSCHKAHGEAMALLAGDCLHSLAFEIIADCGLPSAVGLLAHAAGGGGMGGGQALDLQAAADDESALRQMHEMKTGALFNAAVQIGLLCHTRQPPSAKVTQLRDFAAAFGRLFQIINDIKDTAADSALNKTTYVTLLGRQQATAHAQAAHDEAMEILNGDYPPLAAMLGFVHRAAG